MHRTLSLNGADEAERNSNPVEGVEHKRHGQLFQNRYKSLICKEETPCRCLRWWII